jgi:putative endonuclease
MTEARISLGRAAEEVAATRLVHGGFSIVARNERVRYAELGIAGEIDLIALDGSTLVFVEVKAGRTAATRAGPERPVLAVGPRKQVRLRRLARAWLASNEVRIAFSAIRFDVIGIVMDESRHVHDYEHIRDAF